LTSNNYLVSVITVSLNHETDGLINGARLSLLMTHGSLAINAFAIPWLGSDDNEIATDTHKRFSHVVEIRSRTRKPSCRKDDRAMRPIYGCPENFRESLSTPTATFPEIFNGLLFLAIL